jgi:hypothetical protein
MCLNSPADSNVCSTVTKNAQFSFAARAIDAIVIFDILKPSRSHFAE